MPHCGGKNATICSTCARGKHKTRRRQHAATPLAEAQSKTGTRSGLHRRCQHIPPARKEARSSVALFPKNHKREKGRPPQRPRRAATFSPKYRPFLPPFFLGKTALGFGAAAARRAAGGSCCLAPGVFASRVWALIMARQQPHLSAHARAIAVARPRAALNSRDQARRHLHAATSLAEAKGKTGTHSGPSK